MSDLPPTSDLAPLGFGSIPRPEGGNASLTTRGLGADGAAKSFETRMWITSIGTDLQLSFQEAALRRGVSYSPIRQQERYLKFSAQFKAFGSNYDLLSARIRAHWRLNMNSVIAEPMRFTYYGSGRSWLGFVEDVSHSASNDQVVYERSFVMRVINRDASAEGASVAVAGPYVPSRGDVREDWEGWAGGAELAADALELLGVPAEGDSDA